MASDERERLTRRTESLRQLFEGIADTRARAAISDEIAKHEALIAEIDNTAASEESPAEQREVIVAKGPRDIISWASTIPSRRA